MSIFVHVASCVYVRKAKSPAVIFIDEIDAFGMDRDGQSSEPGLR